MYEKLRAAYPNESALFDAFAENYNDPRYEKDLAENGKIDAEKIARILAATKRPLPEIAAILRADLRDALLESAEVSAKVRRDLRDAVPDEGLGLEFYGEITGGIPRRDAETDYNFAARIAADGSDADVLLNGPVIDRTNPYDFGP